MPMARLSAQGHQTLQSLAARKGASHQDVLDEALELLNRKQFFAEAHREYQELWDDPNAAAHLQKERALLDRSLEDGAER